MKPNTILLIVVLILVTLNILLTLAVFLALILPFGLQAATGYGYVDYAPLIAPESTPFGWITPATTPTP